MSDRVKCEKILFFHSGQDWRYREN